MIITVIFIIIIILSQLNSYNNLSCLKFYLHFIDKEMGVQRG